MNSALDNPLKSAPAATVRSCIHAFLEVNVSHCYKGVINRGNYISQI